jgi:hypothetical protein
MKTSMNDIKKHIEKVEMTFEELLLLQRILYGLKTVEQHEIIDTYSFSVVADDKETFKTLLNKIENHQPF